MPKKNNPTKPGFLSTVDLPKLKNMFVKDGCVIPPNFEVEVEKHLRILMARFIPRKRHETYKRISQMSKVMRRLFSGEIFKIDSLRSPAVDPLEYFFTEDDNAIRAWNREFYTPQKSTPTAPQWLANFAAFLDTHWNRRKEPSSNLTPYVFFMCIPKTIRCRCGAHAYVTFAFQTGTTPSTFNTEHPSKKKNEISVKTDTLAANFLILKKSSLIEVRLTKYAGKKHLLLLGDQAAVFFK